MTFKSEEAPDAAVIQAIKASILPLLRPVRPLAPAWVWVAALLLVAGAIATIGAAFLGMSGLRALTGGARTIIFSVVGLCAGMTGHALTREMVPGTPRRFPPWSLLLVSGAALMISFVLLFDDYGMANFVKAGIPCLATGMSCAIGTALVLAVLLRRGFFVNPAAGGLAAGTLAGLTGVSVLELHCPNLSVPHVIVWHVAVLAASGLAGLALSPVLRGRKATNSTSS